MQKPWPATQRVKHKTHDKRFKMSYHQNTKDSQKKHLQIKTKNLQICFLKTLTTTICNSNLIRAFALWNKLAQKTLSLQFRSAIVHKKSMLFNPFFAFMSHFNTEIYMMKDGRATQTKKDATHTNKKHYVISNIKNKIM